MIGIFLYLNNLNNLFFSQEKSINGYFTVACEIFQYGTLLAHLTLPSKEVKIPQLVSDP